MSHKGKKHFKNHPQFDKQVFEVKRRTEPKWDAACWMECVVVPLTAFLIVGYLMWRLG